MPEELSLWRAARKRGIGGSDAAAILGLSPWKSPMAIWLDKMGLVEERVDPDKEFLLDLGHRMEPVIAQLYERETGSILTIPEAIVSKRFPILIGTPDRYVRDENIGVELKTENEFSHLFGETGTDEVPDHYLLQCAHYMAVLEWERWDIAVLHGGIRFGRYIIRRDLELEARMIDQLLAWWERHIVNKIPPSIDNSDAWRVYLHKKYPLELLPIRELPIEYEDSMQQLARVREGQRVLDGMRSELENKLKSVIGDHAGMNSPFGRITWKKTADSKHIEWEGAYHALRRHAVEIIRRIGPEFEGAAAEMDKLAENCLALMTTTRPGVRRFLFTPPKGASHVGNEPSIIEAGNAAAARAQQLGPGDDRNGPSGAGESSS